MNSPKNDFTSNNWKLISPQPVSNPSTGTVIQSFDLTAKIKFCWSTEVNINKKYVSERDTIFSIVI